MTGLIRTTANLDFDSLAALPGQVPDISTLIPGHKGGGVLFKSILAAVGAQPGARYLTLEAEGGAFSACVPLAPVLEQGLVVYRQDDAPLLARDGGPFRFYIIDVAACGIAGIDRCANVKYLARIDLSDTPGEDTRPSTPSAHAELHQRSALES